MNCSQCNQVQHQFKLCVRCTESWCVNCDSGECPFCKKICLVRKMGIRYLIVREWCGSCAKDSKEMCIKCKNNLAVIKLDPNNRILITRGFGKEEYRGVVHRLSEFKIRITIN